MRQVEMIKDFIAFFYLDAVQVEAMKQFQVEK